MIKTKQNTSIIGYIQPNHPRIIYRILDIRNATSDSILSSRFRKLVVALQVIGYALCSSPIFSSASWLPFHIALSRSLSVVANASKVLENGYAGGVSDGGLRSLRAIHPGINFVSNISIARSRSWQRMAAWTKLFQLMLSSS